MAHPLCLRGQPGHAEARNSMPLVLGARRQGVVVGFGAPITSTTSSKGITHARLQRKSRVMRRLALALLAIFLTAGGLSAVQPEASATDDTAPAHSSTTQKN